jgi:hypothetical protein
MQYIKTVLFLALINFALFVQGQHSNSYWQQHVDYSIEVAMNVENYQYQGTQKLVYTNNSPDELTRVYYHLYFNAFQPGSEMDIRLQNINDPDGRMFVEGKSRIAALSPNEIGYLHPTSLTQDGEKVKFNEEGTVLVVALAKPIPSGGKTTFEMNFEGQVPVQIRRSGRNNKEGVALSMSQWYPKLAEYDFEGWHADPYIAREFHGVWGDFDVKLTIDKDYIVGGTGYLQNPQEIGHGYEATGTKVKKVKGKTLTWHFKAPMVHDFMWAADPDYLHDTLKMENGPTLHFLYKNDLEIIENWKKLQPKTAEAMEFFSKNIGKYPYEQYSVVHGGDGGMEYAMSTLISGGRKLGSLVGVMSHEMAHSWFQFLLATNEAKHEWMDEGFTSYISTLAMNKIKDVLTKYEIDKIFIATDSNEIIQKAINIFGNDKILSINNIERVNTADDSVGAHDRINTDSIKYNSRKYHNYLCGKEVFIDMLLLSKCNYFIRSFSAISDMAIFFNDKMKEVYN